MRCRAICTWIFRAGLVVALTPVPEAAGLTVHDPAAQHTRRDQLQNAREQAGRLQEILDVGRAQLEAFTGSRGYGEALSSGFESDLPAGGLGLADMLAGLTVGGLAKELARRLAERVGLEVEEPVPGAGSQAHHNLRVRRSHGQEILATAAYQEAVEDLEVVRALSRSIEAADRPKDILDLQARLLAQGAKSSLIVARILAAAELNRARQAAEVADRALRVRRLVEPRFINPHFGN